MFCGASDTRSYAEIFFAVCSELGLSTPVHFINGEFNTDNYRGPEGFELNSELSVDNSDILIFVVNQQYGKITWETEFEYARKKGKSFLIFCESSLYQRYIQQNVKGEKDGILFSVFKNLEWGTFGNQITIQTFERDFLGRKIKEGILNLIREALKLKEVDNARKSFFHQYLYSSHTRAFRKEDVNEWNDKQCHQILFDAFEAKEVRKRAMDYFMVSQTLSQEDLVRLCLDMEQGVSRKAVAALKELIGNRDFSMSLLFEEVLSAIANEGEVGLIRRAITTFGELDLRLAVKYFKYFFPASDPGTPKRIIFFLDQKWDILIKRVESEIAFRLDAIALIQLCKDKENPKSDWKKLADDLLERLGSDSSGNVKKATE
jgi:hypothetical protein